MLTRYGGLGIAIALGLILRFWNLDLKPLWLDETITLLFSLGRRYDDVPREVLLPLSDLLQTFTWQPQSCGAIAQAITQQSTHPPLFFCLMHQWMGYLQGSELSLRWQVRSLAALFGTGAIVILYILNRVAFSHRAGVWAAMLMAVSPFAVYLSQEARHYTLPMLIIAASLIPLIQLCDQASAKQRFLPWCAWVGLNSLGFYVHYFCILAFVAQVITLTAIFLQQRRALGGVAIASGSVMLSIMPWLPVLLSHTQRPETDWLKFNSGTLGLHWLEPIGRLLASCIVTVIMLPVEDQPLLVTAIDGLLMVGFIGYLVRWLWQGRKDFFQTQPARQNAQVLQYFLLAIGVEYLFLIYILHKDLTLAFRYNFIFYPAVCALLAASVSQFPRQGFHALGRQVLPWALILVGILSTGFVVTDVAFAKPFAPKPIAQRLLNASPQNQLAVVKNYSSSQDVALGLSFALATEQFKPSDLQRPSAITWGFTKVFDPAEDVLAMKAQGVRRSPLSEPFTFWRIGSLNMTKPPMTAKLKLQVNQNVDQTTATCLSSDKSLVVMGLTYQRYTCKAS